MTIVYVGGQVSGRAGATTTTDITFSLTGGTNTAPQTGDLVLITVVVGSQARNPDCYIPTSGYSALTQLNSAADTYDTSLCVSYKWMDGTPDTIFTLPSTGHIDDAQRYTVQVFRNVDRLDWLEAINSATGIDTSRCTPASVTPISYGACVVICGGGAAATGAAYTAPLSFETNFLTGYSIDTNDALIGSGYAIVGAAVTITPGVYGGGSTSTSASWAVYTLVLKPVIPTDRPHISGGTEVIGVVANSGSLTIPEAPNVVAGDLLILVVATQTGGAVTTPTGWEVLPNTPVTNSLNTPELYLFMKRAGSGDEAVVVSYSGNVTAAGYMLCIVNANVQAPINASASAVRNLSESTVVLPSVTATVDLCLVLPLCAFVIASSPYYNNWTNSNLFALYEIVDSWGSGGLSSVNFGMAAGYKEVAGATGTTNATLAAARIGKSYYTFAIAPAIPDNSNSLFFGSNF